MVLRSTAIILCFVFCLFCIEFTVGFVLMLHRFCAHFLLVLYLFLADFTLSRWLSAYFSLQFVSLLYLCKPRNFFSKIFTFCLSCVTFVSTFRFFYTDLAFISFVIVRCFCIDFRLILHRLADRAMLIVLEFFIRISVISGIKLSFYRRWFLCYECCTRLPATLKIFPWNVIVMTRSVFALQDNTM